MAEEEQVKQEAPKQEEAKQEPQVSEQEVKSIEKEIEVKDNEVLDKLREEFDTRLGQVKSELEAKQAKEMEEYQKAVNESYEKKYGEVKKEIEELKPRKGLVETSNDNPYNEVKPTESESPQAAAYDPRKPSADYEYREADRRAADDFIRALKNR